jgi:hypothetical protein
MARRRKPRKGAGPPPVPVRKAPAEAPSRRGSSSAKPKRKRGEPVPPSMRGVVIRAAIVAALFWPYMVYVGGASGPAAVLLAVIAFALMVPLGMFLDRFRYKRQMRRYAGKGAGTSAR